MKKNTLTNNLENMKTKLITYGNPFTNWYGWN